MYNNKTQSQDASECAMLNAINLSMTWQHTAEALPISEPAQIIALYRLVYTVDDHLFEIESCLFDEPGPLAQQLFHAFKQFDSLAYEHLDSTLYYYVAVSDFMRSQPRTVDGAFDEATYSRAASSYHISPIQALEAIALELRPDTDQLRIQHDIQRHLHDLKQKLKSA